MTAIEIAKEVSSHDVLINEHQLLMKELTDFFKDWPSFEICFTGKFISSDAPEIDLATFLLNTIRGNICCCVFRSKSGWGFAKTDMSDNSYDYIMTDKTLAGAFRTFICQFTVTE